MSLSNPTVAIQLSQLSKQYGTTLAVDQVDLSVLQGESVALLGPNGAGKTTLLDMIEGLTKPSNGHVSVFGLSANHDPSAIRQLMGVSLQSTAYLDYVTIGELATLFATIHQVHTDNITHTFQRVGLTDLTTRRFNQLSGGQQQRFSIAMAMLHRPKLILLDEPSTGLDPNARHDVWNLIRSLQADGVTLLLTTHYMEEAIALCHRIVLMNGGKMVADGSLSELIASSQLEQFIDVQLPHPIDPDGLSQYPWTIHQYESGIRITNPAGVSIADVIRALTQQGIPFNAVSMQTPTLEDVFRYYTGRTLS